MCVCVCACVRACVRVFDCVRRFLCVFQCVAPPCTDQKRGPNSRLLLNLIPGHPFTMFSTSLYDDIRTKEASQKRMRERERERERVCFMSMSMSLGLSSVTKGL